MFFNKKIQKIKKLSKTEKNENNDLIIEREDILPLVVSGFIAFSPIFIVFLIILILVY